MMLLRKSSACYMVRWIVLMMMIEHRHAVVETFERARLHVLDPHPPSSRSCRSRASSLSSHPYTTHPAHPTQPYFNLFHAFHPRAASSNLISHFSSSTTLVLCHEKQRKQI